MKVNDYLFTADLPQTETCWLVPESGGSCVDYREEAIPERDPAYRLPAGTGYEEQTVEAVSAECRRDLARRLEQLGMRSSRAAVVVIL